MRTTTRLAVLAMGMAVTLGVWTASASPSRATFPGAPGRIAYAHSSGGAAVIKTMNAAGGDIKALTTLAQSPYGDATPAWSPGGTMIAFVRWRSDETGEIWTMKADGSQQRRLTNNTKDDVDPQWSPDGARIVFASNRDGDFEIYTMDLNGVSLDKITNNTIGDYDPALSPDGEAIAFARESFDELPGAAGTCYQDIWMAGAGGGAAFVIMRCWDFVLQEAVCEHYLYDPDWSSDGSALVASEGCWGSPVLWNGETDTYDSRPQYWVGRLALAFKPSSNNFFAIQFDDQVGNVHINLAEFGNFTGMTLAQAGKQTQPDWQAIPAFPLVDARFSSFEADIVWAYNEGITTGCSAERYCVDDPVTREQMAIFLDRALDLPPTVNDYFSDDDGLTGEGAINRIAEAGITSGCGPSLYCPDGQRDPRADGQLPGPGIRPAGHRDRLLQRRRDVIPRGQHQPHPGGRHHHRLQRHDVLPQGPRHPRPDGGLPAPGRGVAGTMGRGYVLQPGEARSVTFGAILVEVYADRAATDGAFALVETTDEEPGSGPPMHIHHDCAESFYVISGAYRMHVEGSDYECPAGSFIYVPKGARHTFQSTEPGSRKLNLYTPAAMVGYFEELAEAVEHGATDADVDAIGERHGMEVVGPVPEGYL